MDAFTLEYFTVKELNKQKAANKISPLMICHPAQLSSAHADITFGKFQQEYD